jgi:transketolase
MTSSDRAAAAREIVLQQSKRANMGHIGSALGVVELLVALHGVMRRTETGNERDRFVLSKGHAALALYALLFLDGRISQAQLDSFCGDGTLLGVHPEYAVPGIDFSTGSLGHGLSMGAGAALAARLQGSPRRVFVLLSDAELNEGSVWEAAMFAAHQSLSALVAIVDCNGQQAFGRTHDVLDLEPLDAKWRAFGWDVHDVPGHATDDLQSTLAGLDTSAGKPHAILARTVFGRGVSFMEHQIRWHYLPMSDDEFARALDEVRRARQFA